MEENNYPRAADSSFDLVDAAIAPPEVPARRSIFETARDIGSRVVGHLAGFVEGAKSNVYSGITVLGACAAAAGSLAVSAEAKETSSNPIDFNSGNLITYAANQANKYDNAPSWVDPRVRRREAALRRNSLRLHVAQKAGSRKDSNKYGSLRVVNLDKTGKVVKRPISNFDLAKAPEGTWRQKFILTLKRGVKIKGIYANHEDADVIKAHAQARREGKKVSIFDETRAFFPKLDRYSKKTRKGYWIDAWFRGGEETGSFDVYLVPK